MLFRKEVFDAQRSRLYGQVLIATPIGFWFVTGFLSLTIAALIAFLSTASFARIETVRGAVVPLGGIVEVRAPNRGVLTHFTMREGGAVESGQLVGRIIVSSASDDAGTRVAAERSSIISDIAFVEERKAQTAEIVELDLATNDRQRFELAAQIERFDQMRVLQLELLEETERNSERISKLAERNLINAEVVSQQAMQLIRARQDVQRLSMDIQNLTMERDRIDLVQDQTRARARMEELNFETELRRLEGELEIIAGEQAFDIVAPASGTATAVLAREGQTLTGSLPIFSILPHDAALRVELYVPSRAIGFVETGQAVRLLLDAFPYQRYGAQNGYVTEVTSSVITHSSAEFLVEITEPVYRVTVEIDTETVAAHDREFPIQPGMLLNANIVLEERTILAWLLEPLLSVARRT